MSTPLDYGFMEMSSMSELVVQKPRHKIQQEVPLDADGKYIASTIKLNNNKFVTMDGLMEALPKIISMPDSITWIDLSFNKLTRVEPVLVQLKNLHILYLHGNAIADFPHLEILNRATLLKTLTLHGNPVDRTSGYRFIVLSWLRQLKNMDFSAVTEFDRMQAELWGRRWSVQKNKMHGKGY
ncbi:leucine-rich repeat-containing protein 51-like [Paramacrobiotus metropolitanus]|uniref:leucine-rich repeat-containing protein 51-like n=1 Tax=Paramacrobiotus metropolitanus TaxID=2943436 RepID=UPI00244597E1|nr:leucine-rich repeat-containing protein 51-like [Paramacrobiotus metropolitanus]